MNRKTRYAIFPVSPPTPRPRSASLSLSLRGLPPPPQTQPHLPHPSAPHRSYKYATHPTSTVSFSHRRAAPLRSAPSRPFVVASRSRHRRRFVFVVTLVSRCHLLPRSRPPPLRIAATPRRVLPTRGGNPERFGSVRRASADQSRAASRWKWVLGLCAL